MRLSARVDGRCTSTRRKSDMGVKRKAGNSEVAELLRKMLIVQLGLAGVRRQHIRTIVGCDMNLVTQVLKLVDRNTGKK